MNFPETLPKNSFTGSLHLEWKRCGQQPCRCASGLLHGPYVYRRWREGGKQRKAYLPMSNLSEFIESQKIFQTQFPRSSEIRKLLREMYDG